MNEPKDSERKPDADRGNRAFLVVIPVAGLFVVTVFAMVAATFGDPAAPPARFFEEHGLTVIGVEAVLLVVACVAAMAVDRWHALRNRKRG